MFGGAGLHVFSETTSGIAASTGAFGRTSTLRNRVTPACGSTAQREPMKPTENGTGEALLSFAITIQRTPKRTEREKQNEKFTTNEIERFCAAPCSASCVRLWERLRRTGRRVSQPIQLSLVVLASATPHAKSRHHEPASNPAHLAMLCCGAGHLGQGVSDVLAEHRNDGIRRIAIRARFASKPR